MTEEMNKLPNAAEAVNAGGAREGQRQPQAAMASASGGSNSTNDIDADLQARLENLRRE